jgi:hypothetical protein
MSAKTKSSSEKKSAAAKKDIAESYNAFKEFEGKQYSGMKIGRSHTWFYDKGEWKEKKITPDLWEINYAVTKRRKGRAPEGSGVPVGTEYHWYIVAHQHVKKLDANSYTTAMSGQKFKVAHKRFDSEKWSASENAQRKRMIRFLKELIEGLEKDVVEKPKASEEKIKKPKKEIPVQPKKETKTTVKKKSKTEPVLEEAF